MENVDPDTLLEWLQTGTGEQRDVQLMALEQLCMTLLMSDNIDQCFESCPPRTFLPALCKIFLDETATENVLEVEGAVKAICNRLAVAEMDDRTSKDLAEQCVKLLEHICQRESTAVFDAGGLQCMLTLVRQHGQCVHKDTVHSAMSVVTRLCSKVEPNDASLPECSASLGALLEHEDLKVSECALRCFAALTDRFMRKSMDPVEMAQHGNLVEHLLSSLVTARMSHVASNTSLTHIHNVSSTTSRASNDSPAVGVHRPASFISIVISVLSNLCRGSPLFIPALKSVLTSKEERCIMDTLRLCDLVVLLLCEGRSVLPKSVACVATSRNESG
ncbi:unnamed protein product [Gongylonema pulchrum]|uniref:E3 ubiquitin-protein ligase n=1 Tax=Gongylonema pulchrum TaxID=637853 RepID=A0A183DV15_9BILA|nr:unnamed protein product [Gongylonema pulchrum]